MTALRAKTKSILLAELERTFASRLKHLGEGDRAALTQMMESATNKLLHSATTKLKASATTASDADPDLVNAVRHLFELHEPTANRDEESTKDVSDTARDSREDEEAKPSVH